MTKHTFVLCYQDDWRGRRKARKAVNKWYLQGLFCQGVWGAFYDTILDGKATDMPLAKVGLVMRPDATAEAMTM